MTEKSDKRIILQFLKQLRGNKETEGWVLAGNIRSRNTDFGWIGFRGDRNVRELVKDGYLEKRLEGKYAVVRYKIQEPISREEESKQLVLQAMR